MKMTTRPRAFQGLVIAAVLATTAVSQAAIPADRSQGSAGSMQMTKESLSRPLQERLSELRGQSDAYKNLQAIAFKKSSGMDLRWKAITAMGRLGGEKSRVDLEKALKSQEWFMRNAGLVAFAQMDRAGSVAWARKLMSDRALVVRAAAVDVLANARDASSAPLLWQKLYAKENYKRQQSLFIRRRIVEALAELEGKGRESKFIAVLNDKDQSLHEPAIEALERITAKSLGTPGESVPARRAQWQEWYSANKASL